jgi:hypothetical protein
MKTAIAVSILLLGATACGSDAAVCLAVPCPIPMAVRLTVEDGATGTPVTNASLTYTGPFAGDGSCGSAICIVSGGPGTYEIDVSAPGYATAHRRVVVAGAAAKGCGCASAETQQVTVGLTRAG